MFFSAGHLFFLFGRGLAAEGEGFDILPGTEITATGPGLSLFETFPVLQWVFLKIHGSLPGGWICVQFSLKTIQTWEPLFEKHPNRKSLSRRNKWRAFGLKCV